MFSADRSLGSHRWPVVRLVGGSQTEVVLLSTRFFALTTHWQQYVGRHCTVPCCGDDCPLCETHVSRGIFFLAVGCNSRLSILELGGQSSNQLEQHCKLLHGGMRVGHVLRLIRRGAKQPVHSEVVRHQDNCAEVAPLDLAAKCMALYKFPPPNPGEDLVAYSERCARMSKMRLDRLVEAAARRS